jgi:hypothetical protein
MGRFRAIGHRSAAADDAMPMLQRGVMPGLQVGFSL